jgi:hypothetical protein
VDPGHALRGSAPEIRLVDLRILWIVALGVVAFLVSMLVTPDFLIPG